MRSAFSVQPLCSLCLGGCSILLSYNHGDTVDTEVAQRNSNSYTLNSLLLRISASLTCCRRIASCDRSHAFDLLFFFCFPFCFRAGNRPHQTPRQAPPGPNNEESAHRAGSWSIVYLRRPKHSTIFSQTTSRRS